MRKKLCLVFFVCCLLTFITSACSENTELVSEEERPEFIFQPLDGFINFAGAYIEQLVVQGEYIYFTYIAHAEQDFPLSEAEWEDWTHLPPDIVIMRLAANGGELQRIEIPREAYNFNLVGFDLLTTEGFVLITQDIDFEGGRTILHHETYDAGGRLLSREKLLETIFEFFVVDIQFGSKGEVIILAHTNSGREIHILGQDLNFLGRLEADDFAQMLYMRTDHFIVLDYDESASPSIYVLRDIDIENGTWGNTVPFTLPSITTLIPASADSFFDLYVADSENLYTYTIATGESLHLLNWLETGFIFQPNSHVGFFADGRLVKGINIHNTQDWTWSAEIAVLTPALRSEVPAREVLSLVGIRVPLYIQTEVLAFNRESLTHQIEITDHFDFADGMDRQPGLERLYLDIMSGQIPDIIYVGELETEFDTMIRQGFFMDLLPFIDEDLDIQPTDLFWNILEGRKNADGSLSVIAGEFAVATMIGRTDVASDANNGTIYAMLDLLEESVERGVAYPFGHGMSAAEFLVFFLPSSGLINLETGEVDLESELFIRMLEFSSHLPPVSDPFQLWQNRVLNILRNEQVLARTEFGDSMGFMQATLGENEIGILGIPSYSGSRHDTYFGHALGIGVASPHADAAWSFIRRFLLPNHDHTDGGFPLRRDKFEYELNASLNDQAGLYLEAEAGTIVRVDAINEEGAKALYDLISSATHIRPLSRQIGIIIEEEMLPFLTGDRTATDTARIMQSRIQTFVSEQFRS